MIENITVDEAIKKGHRMVTYPGLVIMLGLMGMTYISCLLNKYPAWVWITGFGSALGLSWLLWSVRITKWKVWAFDNVRNVHELKKRAIQEKLIWPDSSMFNKTEIWSAADREKWHSLQAKFLEKDEFIPEEDLTLLSETIIYYAKAKNYFEMIWGIVFIGIAIFVMLRSDIYSYVFGAVISVLGAYTVYNNYREATNTEPQIIINEEGLQTISTPFHAWKDISDEDAEREQAGKHVHYYLVYHHPGGTERLLIDEYDVDFKELRRLLKIYRSRSMRK